MAWLKLIIFILVTNFITGMIGKAIVLFELEMTPILTITTAVVSTYLAYKILVAFINKFPDNYIKHKGWIWLYYLVSPLGLFGYYVYVTDREIAQIVYPYSAIFLDVLAGWIIAFFVSEKITEKAKNDRLQKRRIAEAKAEAEAEAEAEARVKAKTEAEARARAEAMVQAKAEARAENRAYLSQPSSGVSQSDQDKNIDEDHYETALSEFNAGQIVNSTYSKALVLSKGDEQAAKWTYIQLRAEKLQEVEET
ncbi:hypothetical protein N9H20_02565 [Planktomarina temperata]|nr:hypothetical protein [Planktomarina temperata]